MYNLITMSGFNYLFVYCYVKFRRSIRLSRTDRYAVETYSKTFPRFSGNKIRRNISFNSKIYYMIGIL